MGLFGKKQKAPRDKNYINFNNVANAPYMVTYIQQAMMKDVGYIKPIEPEHVIRYLGQPVHLIEIEFQQGALRLTNYPYGDVTFEGKTFFSTGELENFDDVQESMELNQKGITIKLNSVSPTILAILNSGAYVRAPVTGYIAFMDPVNPSATPLAGFVFSSGYVNKPTIKYDSVKGTSKIQITTTANLERLNNSGGLRTAHATHFAKYPDDHFFAFANATNKSRRANWRMK